VEPIILVALGSNLGDSKTQLEAAMSRLEQLAGAKGKRSSLWSSSPVDCPPGTPDFINAALALPIPVHLTPESWLVATQALEREFGRRPKLVVNESRPLDVDLLVWGPETRTGPNLTVPHPRAHLRRFVLAPLAELVPKLIWPGQACTVEELLKACPLDPGLRRLSVEQSRE
jgi:2-amino-4-hydroxy-6-hydroxymethyldihydropteridine diphosphokinase